MKTLLIFPVLVITVAKEDMFKYFQIPGNYSLGNPTFKYMVI